MKNPRNQYDRAAVQAMIDKDKRIGAREARQIHALLKGRAVARQTEDLPLFDLEHQAQGDLVELAKKGN